MGTPGSPFVILTSQGQYLSTTSFHVEGRGEWRRIHQGPIEEAERLDEADVAEFRRRVKIALGKEWLDRFEIVDTREQAVQS